MLSQKRSIFPLHPLTESLPEPVIRWSLGQMEGRREAGRSWRRGTPASLLLQSQQRFCCSAELHSIIWLINSWSNPVLPGFWQIFLFWGASQQFAKSTGLHRVLPIPDKKATRSVLFWDGVYALPLEGTPTALRETKPVLSHGVEPCLNHSDAKFGRSTEVLYVHAPVWLPGAWIIQKTVTDACSDWVSSLRNWWQRHVQCSKGNVFIWLVERYFQCTADQHCQKAPMSRCCALSSAKLRLRKVSSHPNINTSLFIAMYCCLQTTRHISVLY